LARKKGLEVLKELLKNRLFLTVLTSVGTIIGTTMATAAPEVFRVVCLGKF